MKKIEPRPRTVTIQLDAELAQLLDAVHLANGSLSTPTQLARAAVEAGLIRLAVPHQKSPSVDVREAIEEALNDIHRSRVDSACWELSH